MSEVAKALAMWMGQAPCKHICALEGDISSIFHRDTERWREMP